MNSPYETPSSNLTDSANSAAMLNGRLYKISGIGLATFLGSFAAGGFLARRNFISLGRPVEGNKYFIWSIIGTIVFLGLTLLIPEDLNVPNTAFAIVQVIIMVQLGNKWFKEDMDKIPLQDGQLFSNWRAAGIGLLFTLLLLAIIVSTILFLSYFDLISL